MKLFAIVACVLAAVRADVSHLPGHGYNYDKPSLVFDVPKSVSVSHQHISTPINDNLLPHSHLTEPDAHPLQIHHEEHHEISQAPSNEYLPPTTHSNDHPEIAQLQYNAPTTAPVLISQAVQGPSNEYLPPQTQYSGPAAAPVQTPSLLAISPAQSHFNTPHTFTLHHHDVSQAHDIARPHDFSPVAVTTEYLPPPVHYNAPIQNSVNHLESSQPITSPVSEYFSQTPVHQQEVSHTVTEPQPEYSAPAQTPHHHPEIPQTVYQPQFYSPAAAPVHHQEISHTVTVNHQEYSAPAQAPIHHHELPQAVFQPQYSAPAAAPVHHHEVVAQPLYSAPTETPHHHHELPQSVFQHQPPQPVNNYLPPQQQYNAPTQILAPAPVPLQYQEVHQQFPIISNDYLPPAGHHHHEHHQEDGQAHGHHHAAQDTSAAEGYHYDVPTKRFRF